MQNLSFSPCLPYDIIYWQTHRYKRMEIAPMRFQCGTKLVVPFISMNQNTYCVPKSQFPTKNRSTIPLIFEVDNLNHNIPLHRYHYHCNPSTPGMYIFPSPCLSSYPQSRIYNS